MKDYYKSALGKIKLSESEKAKAKALFFADSGQTGFETSGCIITNPENASRNKQEKKEDIMSQNIMDQNKGNQNPQNRNLKRLLKPAAAIAACLALTLTAHTAGLNLGKLAGNPAGSTASGNSFVITAYAKELTKTGKIYADQYTVAADESFEGSMEEMQGMEFTFPVTCKGENIDTVTYTIQNGAFQISNPIGSNIVISGEELADEDKIKAPVSLKTHFTEGIDLSEGTHVIPNSINFNDYEDRQYKSFTVDFTRQTDDMTIIGIVDSVDAWDEAKKNAYRAAGHGFSDLSQPETEKKLCDFLTKDFGITCTATFKDGTTESKNIVISNEIVKASELEGAPEDDSSDIVVRCFSIQ